MRDEEQDWLEIAWGDIRNNPWYWNPEAQAWYWIGVLHGKDLAATDLRKYADTLYTEQSDR